MVIYLLTKLKQGQIVVISNKKEVNGALYC